MNGIAAKLLIWTPRILGVVVWLFLAQFALDAFGEGRSVIEGLPDFVLHLAPAMILLAVVAVSWRREWVGGFTFTGFALTYAWIARDHVSWIAAISGPLLLVGILFLASWACRGRLRAAG